jgi:hypothetical protein
MAIPKIAPLAGERMIYTSRWQGLVGREQPDNFQEKGVEFLAEEAGLFAATVPFETAGVFNRPHSGSKAVRWVTRRNELRVIRSYLDP